jgi:hypothetical protein
MKSWRLRSSEHYISINVIIVPAADSVAKLVHFEMNWDPTITGRVAETKPELEPEPKLLAGAGAGILKFRLRLRLQGKLK